MRQYIELKNNPINKIIRLIKPINNSKILVEENSRILVRDKILNYTNS